MGVDKVVILWFLEFTQFLLRGRESDHVAWVDVYIILIPHILVTPKIKTDGQAYFQNPSGLFGPDNLGQDSKETQTSIKHYPNHMEFSQMVFSKRSRLHHDFCKFWQEQRERGFWENQQFVVLVQGFEDRSLKRCLHLSEHLFPPEKIKPNHS